MSNANNDNIFSGTKTQLFAALSGTLLSVSDGMHYGWTAPMIPYFESASSHIQATKYETEWLETTFMAGSLLGIPFTIILTNKIGRKRSLITASLVSLVCWLIIAVGTNMIHLHIARFILGIEANMSFVTAPMYIAEIADHKIRGFLSSIIYLMMLVGFVIVYSIGAYLPYIASPIVGGVIIITGLVIFTFMPESPYYLLMNDKFDEADKSLKFFRPGRDTKQELDDMSTAVQRQKTERGRIQDLFLIKSNRKAIIIMSVLNMGQHIAGISVILMNLHSIIAEGGSIYLNSSISGIIFSVIMLISAQFSSLVVDKFGRKVLLLFSTIGSGICLTILAIYFNLKIKGYDVTNTSWVPVASIMLYAATFKCGLGIVPIVITGEIFSAKIKSMGMTIADATYVVGAIVSIQIYQWLSELYGIHVPFYIFAIGSFLVTLFTEFYIPETKGKTLEEIQQILKGQSHVRRRRQSKEFNREAIIEFPLI